MNIIFQTFILILILVLFEIYDAWLRKSNAKHNEVIIEKVIGKVSSLLTSKILLVKDQYKTGPWYLLVYAQENNIPIWISNNNIRSVHPDLKNRKIIIKQFNGEDMVIENVDNYELQSANDMSGYDM